MSSQHCGLTGGTPLRGLPLAGGVALRARLSRAAGFAGLSRDQTLVAHSVRGFHPRGARTEVWSRDSDQSERP